MLPIGFWILGVLSLLAGLLAVGARRPARSVQALVVVLAATAGMVALLGAPLLAFEMLLVIAGTAALIWVVVVRPGRMRLGPPGRARLNVTRMVGFFVCLWLVSLLLWTLAESPGGPPQRPAGPGLSVGFGLWAALAVLGSSAVTAWSVVAVRRHRDAEREEGS